MPLVKVGMGGLENLDAREPEEPSREYQVFLGNLYGESLYKSQGKKLKALLIA